ncbi:uncharacterized protein LOC131846226 [Achroia grisella]|uniref:uncharacterized protein LOC131846226 n=1 Tax=Achroia grisella TaxID=688607 RepID=UPI0027D32629|nr:uncharacterized protein LOC131846226 [Achroia grisella]
MADPKILDIQRKIKIINHIIKECQKTGEPVHQKLKTHYYKNVAKYTGEKLDAIKYAHFSPTYPDLCDKIKENDTKQIPKYNSSVTLRQLMVDYYIKQQIPIQKNHIPLHINTSDSLKKSGFKWHDIPGTNKCIFIENPEQQAKRMRYLINMKKFREENRPIVYIAHEVIQDTVPSSTTTAQDHILIAASPQIGLIDCSMVTSSRLNIIEWFQIMVQPHLTESHVVVIGSEYQETDADLDVPKPEDTTAKMISWLDNNKINYKQTMHRSELYALIERYNTAVFNESLHKEDAILKAHGLDVLRRPNWEVLDYFQHIWIDIMKENMDKSKCDTTLKTYIRSYNMETWQKFEEIIAKNEQSIYDEDRLLEDIIDKLLTKAKYDTLESNDFSAKSDVKPFDPYEYNIIL